MLMMNDFVISRRLFLLRTGRVCQCGERKGGLEKGCWRVSSVNRLVHAPGKMQLLARLRLLRNSVSTLAQHTYSGYDRKHHITDAGHCVVRAELSDTSLTESLRRYMPDYTISKPPV